MKQFNDQHHPSQTIKCVKAHASLWSSAFFTVTVAIALSGCGGGAVYVDTPPFDIHFAISGQPSTGVVISPGAMQRVILRAGQYIDLNASEPVTWSLNVGGTIVPGPGVTVYYGNVAITLRQLTSSSISIDTAISYPLAAPLSITLVATSTYDFAQVATIEVILMP
jgi:hypothetical protein